MAIFSLTVSFVAKAEELTSPYEFGVYDLLVLPESFPYGGESIISIFCCVAHHPRYGEQLSDIRHPHSGRW